MSTKQENFLKTLQKNLEGGAVQPEELVEVVAMILKVIKELRESLSDLMAQQKGENDTSHSERKAELTKFHNELNQAIEKVKNGSLSDLQDAIKTLKSDVKGVSDRIPELPDIAPLWAQIGYVESLVMKMVEDVRSQIPPSFDATEIQEEIKEHERRIDELEENLKKVPRGGGGTSAIGVRQAFKYIAHTEQPVGDIDGVNLTYTVKNTIWWIAGFTLNGENIAQLPNYTVSGNTITFSSALPAAYSGKDFEVKYIG